MVLFDLTMHDAASGLPGLNRRLEALGAHFGWPARSLGALQVGLDECITNIFEHGYSATGGCGPVRVVVAVSSGATGTGALAQTGTIFARVEDWGPGFDPTGVTAPAGACSEGLNASLNAPLGQGLRLLHHLCSGLRYRRDPNRNRLSLQVPA